MDLVVWLFLLNTLMWNEHLCLKNLYQDYNCHKLFPLLLSKLLSHRKKEGITLIIRISPTRDLKVNSGTSQRCVLFFSIRPLDFHFCGPCRIDTSKTSPGHSRAKPAIPATTIMATEQIVTCFGRFTLNFLNAC